MALRTENSACGQENVDNVPALYWKESSVEWLEWDPYCSPCTWPLRSNFYEVPSITACLRPKINSHMYKAKTASWSGLSILYVVGRCCLSLSSINLGSTRRA